MAKILEREKALKLRRKGNSIADIAKLLKVSKSTVSYWCRDIQLSKTDIDKLALKSKSSGIKSFLNLAEAKRSERIANTRLDTQKGETTLGTLSKRDILCIGVGLYWGEGYKRGNQEFGFTNSDAQMIIFYILWLKTVFHISEKNLTLRVSINEAHKNRIAAVEDYWSNLTKVPLSQFTKSSLIKTQSKKIYSNPEQHFGTLRIKVQKGTRRRREVLGMLLGIKNQLY